MIVLRLASLNPDEKCDVKGQTRVTLQKIGPSVSFGRRALYLLCMVMTMGRHSVLKNIEVVAGSDGDDVVFGVPGGVEDFLAEVQTVHADVCLFPLPAHTHPSRLQDRPALTQLPAGLQSHIASARSIKHSKVVVVSPGHYNAGEEEKLRENRCIAADSS